MPGTQRVTEALDAQFAHLGIEGQEPGHQRPVALPGARVHDLTRGLVDDREVGVVEHDVDGAPSRRPRTSALSGAGSTATRCWPSTQRASRTS